MSMFVKFGDILHRATKYWFTDGGANKRRKELAEYRRIEHLDEPTYYERKRRK